MQIMAVSIMNAVQPIYDALIVGGGPAGMSAALALARVCRTSIVFDSGEYRNQGAIAMHTFLSRDGIPPEDFRATARQQIQDKYSAQVAFVNSKVEQISQLDILPGYRGFSAVTGENKTFTGRKLVLATGTEDVLPTDIEGYSENWPSHMHVYSNFTGPFKFQALLTIYTVINAPFVTVMSRKISLSEY